MEVPLTDIVDANVLRWFGHMSKKSGERLARVVNKAEVEGRQARGKPSGV